MKNDKAAAIRYHKGDYAPKILARGQGHAAEVLKKLATENSIPLVKSPELAESLVNCNPFDDIPLEYWNLVAEILGFVYKMRGTDELS